MGNLGGIDIRKIAVILTKEIRTSLNYWLELPIIEWADWLETINELLEDRNK